MNEIDRLFIRLKKEGKKALIAYMAGGYPRFPEQLRIFQALAKKGVDLFEVGVPFSDPIADGPTIQLASQKALASGVTLAKILAWVPRLRRAVHAPVVLMSYLNPILAYGEKRFAEAAGRAGVSGLIVPDLIPEEGGPLQTALRTRGIALIYLVSPTTPRERLKMIAARTDGFLYAVSVAGVTGARRGVSSETARWLKSLSSFSRRPVCVGFGISDAKQVRRLRSSVDGFIVGSALIDRVRNNRGRARVKAVEKFISPLSKECHYGR